MSQLIARSSLSLINMLHHYLGELLKNIRERAICAKKNRQTDRQTYDRSASNDEFAMGSARKTDRQKKMRRILLRDDLPKNEQ